jgi:hypothetical protein
LFAEPILSAGALPRSVGSRTPFATTAEARTRPNGGAWQTDCYERYPERTQTLNTLRLLTVLMLALGSLTADGAEAQPNVSELLTRVGERVAEFYKRVKNIICIETSTVQPIDSSHSPQGFARTVESELRIELDGEEAGEATVLRKIRKVNGRPPLERDKKDRSGCTDPNPLSSEPLAFLMPPRRSEYTFKIAGMAKERDRTALLIEFLSVNRRSNPELIEDPGGHEDCFDWSGHIASRGRLWVDADNYDVLRVERGLGGPVDVRVPALIQRRYRMDPWAVIVREDTAIRYKAVAFTDPDEILLLPESIHSLIMVRGGLQSTRRWQTFSDYRRFVTEGKVVQ